MISLYLLPYEDPQWRYLWIDKDKQSYDYSETITESDICLSSSEHFLPEDQCIIEYIKVEENAILNFLISAETITEIQATITSNFPELLI